MAFWTDKDGQPLPFYGLKSLARLFKKHRKLNELVKRSAHKCFYNFITKYTDIFAGKMREAFALQTLLTFLQQNYWHIYDINI